MSNFTDAVSMIVQEQPTRTRKLNVGALEMPNQHYLSANMNQVEALMQKLKDFLWGTPTLINNQGRTNIAIATFHQVRKMYLTRPNWNLLVG